MWDADLMHETWNGRFYKYHEIQTFPKAKIVDTNEIPGSPFFS